MSPTETEDLLHAMHDACKFIPYPGESTTRAILEGVLHRHHYGDREGAYRGNKCACPHCADAYRVWDR